MESTVSLIDLLKIWKKRWKLILFFTLAAALIGGFVSLFIMKPVYQAATQILVNQKNTENKLDLTLLQGNVDLINTYSDIIKSPAILEKVIQELALTEGVEDLTKKISVTNRENSQVFSLIVENGDPNTAVEIVNAVSETFQQEIIGIMNVDNVSILARAEHKEDPQPVKPKPVLTISVSIIIGFMIGIGTALLIEFLDNTLKGDQDVSQTLGLPVLGVVQKMPRTQRKKKDSNNQSIGGGTIVS